MIDSIQKTNQMYQTKRVTVSSIEEILFQSIPILDHGFIRIIDYMGDDSAVVQSARVSYGNGTKTINNDRGLINYLMKHEHNSPFEMCEIKLHVKLPIFVARQWIRHRTANVNEVSARYSILGREFYVPDSSVVSSQSLNNKQGREDKSLTPEESDRVIKLIREESERSYDTYSTLLNENEVARELARMNLSLNYYTEFYWKIDLRNLLNFIQLRSDANAQYEIRVYSDELLKIVKLWVPLVHSAFIEYHKNSFTLSNSMLNVIKRLTRGEKIEQKDSGLTQRDWNELMNRLSD